jgi:hypothetical protein
MEIKRIKKNYGRDLNGKRIDLNDNPIIAVGKCRAGNTIYKGFEIPQYAKIFKDKFGEECYLSSVQNIDGTWFATVCYFTRKNDRFYTHLYDKIAPYFE